MLHVPLERGRNVGALPEKLNGPGEEIFKYLTINEWPEVRVVGGAENEHVAKLTNS